MITKLSLKSVALLLPDRQLFDLRTLPPDHLRWLPCVSPRGERCQRSRCAGTGYQHWLSCPLPHRKGTKRHGKRAGVLVQVKAYLTASSCSFFKLPVDLSHLPAAIAAAFTGERTYLLYPRCAVSLRPAPWPWRPPHQPPTAETSCVISWLRAKPWNGPTQCYFWLVVNNTFLFNYCLTSRKLDIICVTEMWIHAGDETQTSWLFYQTIRKPSKLPKSASNLNKMFWTPSSILVMSRLFCKHLLCVMTFYNFLSKKVADLRWAHTGVKPLLDIAPSLPSATLDQFEPGPSEFQYSVLC